MEIKKDCYLECLKRMIDKANERLNAFSEGDFVYVGKGDGGFYYRVESIKLCEYSEKGGGFFSPARIDILQEPVMIVKPVASQYFYHSAYTSEIGKPSKNIIRFQKGGGKCTYRKDHVVAPSIYPLYRWEEGAGGRPRGIEDIGELKKLDNVRTVGVLIGVKQDQEKRERENERIRQQQLDRKRQSDSITQKEIEDLFRSI